MVTSAIIAGIFFFLVVLVWIGGSMVTRRDIVKRPIVSASVPEDKNQGTR